MFQRTLDDEGRVAARAVTPDDIDAYAALLARNQRHLRQWFADMDVLASEAKAREFFTGFYGKMTRGEGVRAGIFVDEVFVGFVAQNEWDGDARSCTLEYWIDGAFEGYGLVTRAIAALLDHAFDAQSLSGVEIHISVENERSRAVMERLGIPLDRITRGSERRYNRDYDQAVYRATPESWAATRAARTPPTDAQRVRHAEKTGEMRLRAALIESMSGQFPVRVMAPGHAFQLAVPAGPPFELDDEGTLLRTVALTVFALDADGTMDLAGMHRHAVRWVPSTPAADPRARRALHTRLVRVWSEVVADRLRAHDAAARPEWFDDRMGLAELVVRCDPAASEAELRSAIEARLG